MNNQNQISPSNTAAAHDEHAVMPQLDRLAVLTENQCGYLAEEVKRLNEEPAVKEFAAGLRDSGKYFELSNRWTHWHLGLESFANEFFRDLGGAPMGAQNGYDFRGLALTENGLEIIRWRYEDMGPHARGLHTERTAWFLHAPEPNIANLAQAELSAVELRKKVGEIIGQTI